MIHEKKLDYFSPYAITIAMPKTLEVQLSIMRLITKASNANIQDPLMLRKNDKPKNEHHTLP